MEDEEIGVQLVVVDQLHPDLVLAMRERAEDVVLAVCTIVWVVCAELGLVLLQAVELLHLVVAFVAVIALGAHEVVVLVLDVLDYYDDYLLRDIAELAGDRDLHPALVLVGVEEPALLVVVLGLDLALVDLEPVEHQVLVELLLVLLGVVGAEHHLGSLHLVGGRVHGQVVAGEIKACFLHGYYYRGSGNGFKGGDDK